MRNQGNGSSSFTTLRYFQSGDSTITTGDAEVGTDSVFRLDAAESGDESGQPDRAFHTRHILLRRVRGLSIR